MDAASWHFSEVCDRIASSQLHKDILSYLSCDSLDVASCSQANTKRQVVERLVSILHHVVVRYISRQKKSSNVNQARETFSERAHTVKILHKLRDAKESPVTLLIL